MWQDNKAVVWAIQKTPARSSVAQCGSGSVFADRPYVLGVFSYSALSYMKQYAMPLIVAMARDGKLHTNNRIAFTIP